VTAKDVSNVEVSDTFTVTVTNVNDAPTVANALLDKVTALGLAFSYVMANDTFADMDAGDTLTYSAQLVDDNGNQVGNGSLPSWLAFNVLTRTFSGTVPANGDTSKLFIKVTAHDVAGAQASDVFELAQIVKQASFARVAATTSATGEMAIYGIEVKDLANVDLGFNLSGTIRQGNLPLSHYLSIAETSPNKATVYLRQGVTMQSLIDALGGLSSASFNVDVNNGADTVTDVVTFGGPGSDIQTVTNTSAPNLLSPSSTDITDGAIVYQARAEDANAGLFTFGLSGPDARFFVMNESTGAVGVNSDLYAPANADLLREFLLRDTYDVNVLVTDGVLGQTRSSSTSIVLDRPEVDQNAGVTVVATNVLGNGSTVNNENAEITVTQIPVAFSQLPSGVSMPLGRTELVATQEVDLGAVPTSFSMFVSPSANVNGFWTTVNGALVNLATPELGGSIDPVTGKIDLDLAFAGSRLNHSFLDGGNLLLEGAPAHVDIGALGANPMQISSLFWS